MQNCAINLSMTRVWPAGCTSLIAGRDATVDGSVLASHTNDGGATTDPRLVRVPSRSLGELPKLRNIYATPESYPRFVGKSRGVEAYHPVDNQTEWEPIGQIPEVFFGHLWGP